MLFCFFLGYTLIRGDIMNIKFLGAIGTVTGSSYLLETNNHKILIDFGLYQEEDADNKEMAFDPKNIDIVLLTHAHIDHVGRIPYLFKNGFKGKVYCTHETYELSTIMLKDSAMIQERTNEENNEDREKAGLDPIEPLYNMEDVELALAYFYPIAFNKEVTFENVTFEMFPAGHILGAATIRLEVIENQVKESVCFSGDLGNMGNLLLDEPTFKGECNYLILESTYGNRLHEKVSERSTKLGNLLLDIYKGNKLAIIPSFSVGRTQNIILEIKELLKKEKYSVLKNMPIYIDSPLGLKATEIYENNLKALRKPLQNEINLFNLSNLEYVEEIKDTFSIINSDNPKLVISSSGMCNGGKILFYLKELLGKDTTEIIFIGYQAEKTIGRQLLEKNSSVWINKKEYPVHAKIHKINGFSAHADQEDLINFVKNLSNKPDIIFLTHGEEDARHQLKKKLSEEGYKNIFLPIKNKSFAL